MKRRNFLATITFGLIYGKTLGKDIIKQLKEMEFEDGKFTDNEVKDFSKTFQEAKEHERKLRSNYFVSWYYYDGEKEFGEILDCNGENISLALAMAKSRLIKIRNDNNSRLRLVKFELHNRRFAIEKIELKYPSIAKIKSLKFSKENEL